MLGERGSKLLTGRAVGHDLPLKLAGALPLDLGSAFTIASLPAIEILFQTTGDDLQAVGDAVAFAPIGVHGVGVALHLRDAPLSEESLARMPSAAVGTGGWPMFASDARPRVRRGS
jgi:hypothetical protein